MGVSYIHGGNLGTQENHQLPQVTDEFYRIIWCRCHLVLCGNQTSGETDCKDKSKNNPTTMRSWSRRILHENV